MMSTRVPGTFQLVYLVGNTIMNVTAQDDQLAVFANAAAHLEPAGASWWKWRCRNCAGCHPARPGGLFTLDPDHVGIETFGTAAPIAWSNHWIAVDAQLVSHSTPCRHVWPSELDLMAKITGFQVRDRWAGWGRAPFTSTSHG
jgi:hypothetical protein